MRLIGVVLIVCGVALTASAAGLAMWAQMPGGPHAVLWALFVDADPLAKIALLAAGGAAIATIVMGATSLSKPPPRERSQGLFVIGLAVPLLGVGAGLLGALNTLRASQVTGVTNLMILGPSIAGVLLTIGFCAFVGGVAAALGGAQTRAAA